MFQLKKSVPSIAYRKQMILEKDSSVLGYPGETSRALRADHHNVCKFGGPGDPNYVTVRNGLKSIVSKIMSSDSSTVRPRPDKKQSMNLRAMLAVSKFPDSDYVYFRDQWTQGTSYWLLEEKNFLKWQDRLDTSSSLLWLNGGAATGKSVLVSFIINKLVEQGLSCQYFFIRFSDEKTRNLSGLLRSLAYQIATSMPVFLGKLLELSKESIDLDTADARTIWDRIFKSTLFKISAQQPLYWVIDGLDEARDPKALPRLVSDIASSSLPIRILIASRKISEVNNAMQKFPKTLMVSEIDIDGHNEDLNRFVRNELSMPGSTEFKEQVARRIMGEAQNCFLVSSRQ